MKNKEIIKQISELDEKIYNLKQAKKAEAKELKDTKFELNNLIRQNENKKVDLSEKFIKSILVAGGSAIFIPIILMFNPGFLVALISGLVLGLNTIGCCALSSVFYKKSKKLEKENIELRNKFDNLNTYVEDGEEIESLVSQRNKLISLLLDNSKNKKLEKENANKKTNQNDNNDLELV